MVVALTALVIACSGTAVAATSLVGGDSLIKKNSLSGNRLRGHTLTGKQINLKKLGKVPNAKHADSATNATNATNATHATTATTADGLPALTWTSLPLTNGWVAYTDLADYGGTPAYTKDAEGFVHLTGVLSGAAKTSTSLAALPSGFRPPHGAWVAAGDSNGNFNPQGVNLWISPAGVIQVEPFKIGGTVTSNYSFLSLEGVEFYVG